MKRFNVRVKGANMHPFFWLIFIWRGLVNDNWILEKDCRNILGFDIEIEGDEGKEMIVFGSWKPYAYNYKEWLKDLKGGK